MKKRAMDRGTETARSRASLLLTAAKWAEADFDAMKGMAYPPYYIGNLQRQRGIGYADGAYQAFRDVFGDDDELEGNVGVLALCFAAEMARTGDL